MRAAFALSRHYMIARTPPKREAFSWQARQLTLFIRNVTWFGKHLRNVHDVWRHR